MEQQKLPNSTLILVLGIISIISCCCYGIGVILGIVAFVMAGTATKTYMANPELYTGYQNVKVGKILAIIGMILSAIYLGVIIFMYSKYGMDGIMEMNKDLFEQYGIETN
ncbi:MAG TPA: CCC motif membrane protein [Aequorivita sp.]|nr:CCC motif membrane protein [Aequorivita sp.]